MTAPSRVLSTDGRQDRLDRMPPRWFDAGMKSTIVFLTLLLSHDSFAGEEKKHQGKGPKLACHAHSDCAVGCLSVQDQAAACLLKAQITLRASDRGKGPCPTGPGGALCGCKEEKCTYLHPDEYKANP
jgi:hypothetical protein